MDSTHPSGPLEDSNDSHSEITRVEYEGSPSTPDALQIVLEGAAEGTEESESTEDTDSLGDNEVTGVKWADEVDKQPPPPAPKPPPPPSAPPPPPQPPQQSDALIALEKKYSVLSDRVRVVEHQYLQLNDVLVRFQMMLDQSMGRTDDALQHVSAYQTKSRSVTNELRSQMSAVIQLVGKNEVQNVIKAAAEEAKTQPQFRTGTVSRFSNSRQGAPSEQHQQQQYANVAAEAPQSSWQPRGEQNRGGYHHNRTNSNDGYQQPRSSGGGDGGYQHRGGDSDSWQQRGGRGGNRGGRRGYSN